MESSTANASASEDIQGDIQAPEGMVLPPKDIRDIIEKTAGYVVRNGPIFEDRIRQKEKNNPKFSFLTPSDAYNAFYQYRLSEVKKGNGIPVDTRRPGEPAPAAPVAEPEVPQGPPEPPKLYFSAPMPPNINALDLDVIKLTALHTAMKGNAWMTQLAQREAGNSQFDFLRPQHSYYRYFTELVQQYIIITRPEGIDENTTEEKRIAELKANIENPHRILDRARQRAEYMKWQQEQKQQKDDQEAQERIEYAQIDWQDAVVVETVLFDENDDQIDLPPPPSLRELQSASLEQKASLSLNTRRIEEAMPTDTNEPVYYNPHGVQPEAAPMQPPTVSPIPTQVPYSAPVGMDTVMQDSAAAQAMQPPLIESPVVPARPGQQPMRIRQDYVPRAQARRQGAAGGTALCPNCKQQIPITEMDQHMRIEMLDPRWKEQRAKADSRSATTNLSTADVAQNLKRLASQRSDVFDSSLNPSLDADAEGRAKRMATPDDTGAPAPGPAFGPGGVPNPQTMNIEDQLRHIHERARK
ncbi:Pre-mRNA splicing factor PRP21 like protein-domain-containing protein [Penicillium argentinense]|uniref:Pre-mRNA splicing factor PRP21 like protein-domain-containing protein n=1 Tax=Penicillium argentinense TaxID=1131581 RepID=A0A9W9G2L0_9EURO|nr:Pre-mRNA splicing factor PRP21 like protein-domain-containing protein [Penicillium argentinense]KAJ5110823.1 Pre-mRNA splicing factor PRP21 like protein-domain-containing protein [Penicillium argentinense]